MWRSLGASAWPSLLVLSPHGSLVASFLGGGRVKEMEELIEAMLVFYGTPDFNNDAKSIVLETSSTTSSGTNI
jgi:hypothetical protein